MRFWVQQYHVQRSGKEIDHVPFIYIYVWPFGQYHTAKLDKFEKNDVDHISFL